MAEYEGTIVNGGSKDKIKKLQKKINELQAENEMLRKELQIQNNMLSSDSILTSTVTDNLSKTTEVAPAAPVAPAAEPATTAATITIEEDLL